MPGFTDMEFELAEAPDSAICGSLTLAAGSGACTSLSAT